MGRCIAGVRHCDSPTGGLLHVAQPPLTRSALQDREGAARQGVHPDPGRVARLRRAERWEEGQGWEEREKRKERKEEEVNLGVQAMCVK